MIMSVVLTVAGYPIVKYDGQVFVEVSANYLLWLTTEEIWEDRLTCADQHRLVETRVTNKQAGHV